MFIHTGCGILSVDYSVLYDVAKSFNICSALLGIWHCGALDFVWMLCNVRLH